MALFNGSSTGRNWCPWRWSPRLRRCLPRGRLDPRPGALRSALPGRRGVPLDRRASTARLDACGPEPLVELLFGEFADAAPALPILMGAFVAISLGPLAVNAIVVPGRQRRLATYALAGLAINVALNLVLIRLRLPRGGVGDPRDRGGRGRLALGRRIRHLDEPPALSRFVRAALAAAPATLALWGLSELGASLAILVAAAVVIYGLLPLALRALDLRRLCALLRRG